MEPEGSLKCVEFFNVGLPVKIRIHGLDCLCMTLWFPNFVLISRFEFCFNLLKPSGIFTYDHV
jgi:hypothetical protein